MMNRKEFYEYVKDNVKEYLPESYKDAEIKLQEVEKKQWTEAYWHYNSKWRSKELYRESIWIPSTWNM